MWTALFKDRSSYLALSLFVFFTVWYLLLSILRADDLGRQVFGAAYGVMALFGGICGISISRKWGGFKSLFGRSILMFSFGLLAQEFGQLTYSFYTFFLNVEIPYPSLGDLGYFGSIPFYILGVFLLAKGSGAKVSLKKVRGWFLVFLIPTVLLLTSYFFFLKGYVFEEVPLLVVFLDFGYPFGQAIYVSIAILAYLLSNRVLGGIMKSRVLFILLALVVQFFADYMFLYLARFASIAPGGVNDFVYLTSYFLMTLSLIQFKTVADQLSK